MDNTAHMLSVLAKAIWLRKNDQGEAEVLIEDEGGWHLLFSEPTDAPFSHIMEAPGISSVAHVPLYGTPLPAKSHVCIPTSL